MITIIIPSSNKNNVNVTNSKAKQNISKGHQDSNTTNAPNVPTTDAPNMIYKERKNEKEIANEKVLQKSTLGQYNRLDNLEKLHHEYDKISSKIVLKEDKTIKEQKAKIEQHLCDRVNPLNKEEQYKLQKAKELIDEGILKMDMHRTGKFEQKKYTKKQQRQKAEKNNFMRKRDTKNIYIRNIRTRND